MRVDVEKFLFYGPKEVKEEFFRRAQEIGVIEFIDKSEQVLQETPVDISKINAALKVLRAYPLIEQEEYSYLDQADQIVDEILSLGTTLEESKDRLRFLSQEINRILPFGDFSKQDIAYIEQTTHRYIQFFFAKKSSSVAPKDFEDLIYVTTDHDLDYYISISKKKQSYPGMVEMIFEHTLRDLVRMRKELESAISEIDDKLHALVAYKNLLKESLIAKLNHHNLLNAKSFSEYFLDDSLFAIEGWISKTKITQAHKFLKTLAIGMEPIAVEKSDKVPTNLENTGLARVGEDLVHIYDTPSISDKDPSRWVLWAFTLFFAIIVGDGGYGAIFLLLALFFRFKFPKMPEMGRRFIRLVTLLAVSCIIWGCLTTSFFGIDFSLDNTFKKYAPFTWVVEKKVAYHMKHQDDVYQEWVKEMPHLKDIRMPYEFLSQAYVEKDHKRVYVVFDKFANNVMLELALFIGVIHIIFGLLRNIYQSWAGFGWILFLVGGYLYFPQVLNATSMIHYLFGINQQTGPVIGIEILYAGILIACVLSLIQNRLKGLSEIMNVIQVFADVLSYLRLYALALAGSIMATTFNGLGEEIGILVGIIVILIGHSVNITLGIMGGVIHGLRLNFLEWYHYCFEGGGKLHKPLKLLKIRR